MRLHKCVITCLLLCVHSGFLAQTVRGVLTDHAGEPLANGTLAAYQDDRFVAGAVSDWSGAFELRLRPGCYLLVASMAGYREQYYPCTSVRADSVRLLDVQFVFVDDGDLTTDCSFGDRDPYHPGELGSGDTYSSDFIGRAYGAQPTRDSSPRRSRARRRADRAYWRYVREVKKGCACKNSRC